MQGAQRMPVRSRDLVHVDQGAGQLVRDVAGQLRGRPRSLGARALKDHRQHQAVHGLADNVVPTVLDSGAQHAHDVGVMGAAGYRQVRFKALGDGLGSSAAHTSHADRDRHATGVAGTPYLGRSVRPEAFKQDVAADAYARLKLHARAD